MPFNYAFSISLEATKEIDEIMEYISCDLCNPQAAINLYNSLYESIETLIKLPHSGEPTDFTVLTVQPVKKVFIKNYTMFYFVDEQSKTINVLHIRYSKRDNTTLFNDNN